MKWYVLNVISGKEDEVKRQIQMQLRNVGCKCCIPKRVVPEKKNGTFAHIVKNMFPGYVFLQTKMDFTRYKKIMAIPNIISFLNYTNKKDLLFDPSSQDEEAFFKCIPGNEMEVILELLNPENDIMEYSKFYLGKEKVMILTGPLVGMEGRIKKIDKRKRRAKLAIFIMGQEKLIDIGFEALDPLEEVSSSLA